MALDRELEVLVQFDLFELDPRSYQLRRSGVVVDLPRQALRVLALLVARPNELVTRKEIKEALWPAELHGDFDSRLNFAVKKLREGLGDSADQPRYVQTVRNAGYMFIAPVRRERISTFDSAKGRLLAKDDRIEAPGPPLPANYARNGAPSPVQGEASGAAASGEPPSGLRLGVSAGLIATLAVLASAVAFGAFVLRPHGANPALGSEPGAQAATSEGVPQIASVGPILPQARQKIVIRGRGFGLHVPYVHTDSPYLAIRDETGDWAAGRIIPQNSDDVTLDVESWTDDEILIGGFSGEYGEKGWKLVDGDRLEIRVWNPQSGAGPARFQVAVSSVDVAK